MPLFTATIPSTGESLPRLGLGTYKTFDLNIPSPAATEAAAVLIPLLPLEKITAGEQTHAAASRARNQRSRPPRPAVTAG